MTCPGRRAFVWNARCTTLFAPCIAGCCSRDCVGSRISAFRNVAGASRAQICDASLAGESWTALSVRIGACLRESSRCRRSSRCQRAPFISRSRRSAETPAPLDISNRHTDSGYKPRKTLTFDSRLARSIQRPDIRRSILHRERDDPNVVKFSMACLWQERRGCDWAMST